VRLYLITAALSFALSAALTPLVRALSLRLGWLDAPHGIKTHKAPVPSLGGIAIWLSYTLSLVAMRFVTRFPTGTLRSLRGILLGGLLVFLLGVVDDARKPKGLGFKSKFAVQILAAVIISRFGLRIHFIQPGYLALALTFLWVVGVSNAFNIIDIMDGLCASQAAVAALAFACIAFPAKEIYVGFAAAAVFGAALGFMPWNFSSSRKIFMGDSGSLFLGFILAAVSLGTHYSRTNTLGVYAPLFILLIPIYDTLFVMAMRMLKGQSPFLGSKDHFALRLETEGFSRHQIVAMAAAASIALSVCAFLITRVSVYWALGIYVFVLAYVSILSWGLYTIKVK